MTDSTPAPATATVRVAKLDDLPEIVAMGQEFFAASALSSIAAWDTDCFEATVCSFVNGTVPGTMMVAERDGRVVGMGAFMTFPIYFNYAVKMAQEIFWWVDPSHRFGTGGALLEEMEEHARRAGARIFMMSALSGLRDAALARLFEQRGYRRLERNFIKDLQ